MIIGLLQLFLGKAALMDIEIGWPLLDRRVHDREAAVRLGHTPASIYDFYPSVVIAWFWRMKLLKSYS